MSEMSQAQQPAGGSESMDPTEDIVPGAAQETKDDPTPSASDAADAGDDGSGGDDAGSSAAGTGAGYLEPSEADAPGGGVGSDGAESASDPMPDIAGTGS